MPIDVSKLKKGDTVEVVTGTIYTVVERPIIYSIARGDYLVVVCKGNGHWFKDGTWFSAGNKGMKIIKVNGKFHNTREVFPKSKRGIAKFIKATA